MKPILFNTEMVRAILDGRKTQTRRVMKPQAWCHVPRDCATCNEWRLDGKTSEACPSTCVTTPDPPFNSGDILWVRETWNGDWCDHYIYKADGGSAVSAGYDKEPRWHPSIHMPREAARIFLRVTDVRVERLQDIDDDGVVAEGLEIGAQFDELWNRTLSKSDRAKFGWDANPWVWVIKFERCEKPDEWGEYVRRQNK